MNMRVRQVWELGTANIGVCAGRSSWEGGDKISTTVATSETFRYDLRGEAEVSGTTSAAEVY